MRAVSSREIYRNRWARIREDLFVRPDGSEGVYAVVEKPPFALVIPHDNGIVHLVQQFRYPVGLRQWEFPQGTLEGKPDATPEEIARTELREETGLTAERVTPLGVLYPAYGLLAQEMHVFLAEGLTQGEAETEAEEQDLISRPFHLEEVRNMIRRGELQDGCTVAALYLWDDVTRRANGA